MSYDISADDVELAICIKCGIAGPCKIIPNTDAPKIFCWWCAECILETETGISNILHVVESRASSNGHWIPVIGVRAARSAEGASDLLDSYLEKKKRQRKSGMSENPSNYRVMPYRRMPEAAPAPEAQADGMRAPAESESITPPPGKRSK